tara:strand:+ start:846 stop:1694 length:849 start_codon:yes stop_codon:yes gene_type:complete
MSRTNFTFVITAYRSDKIIDECLKDLPKDIKKIVIDNSADVKLKGIIEKKYENTVCYLMAENLGYGKGNNFGIKKSNTDYVFILNPDTKITDDKFSKIVSLIKNKDFAIAAPQIVEKSKVYKQNKSNDDVVEVEQVPGMAMIINKKKFNNNFFDENIFLYLEEIDLCKRMKNIGESILEINVQLDHLGGQSHGEYDFEMEKSRNWHWMWSKFYFYKKHHNYFFSFLKTLPNFISSFIKFLNYKLIGNKKKSFQYKMRFLGLLNSYMLKNSYYRPYKKKIKFS